MCLKFEINEITEKILPPLPVNASDNKKREYEVTFNKIKEKVKNGQMDDVRIKIEIEEKPQDDSTLPPQVLKAQESLSKMFNIFEKKEPKEVSIRRAKELLKDVATEDLINDEDIKSEALKRAENGIVFIDEIDKIAVSSSHRQDPSKEGVQRDLLPIVEGSVVNTKYGNVNTDHILFISAGAFHLSKPSDLIPELQGRFPLRVELDSLDEDALYKILTQPKHSLIKQYQKLLEVEGVELRFTEEALKSMARNAYLANEKTEDIGARRLHTITEKVLEDINFYADEHKGEVYEIDDKYVEEKLGVIIESEDSAKYIL